MWVLVEKINKSKMPPEVQNHWRGIYKDLQDPRVFLGWGDSKGILGSLGII